MLGPVKGLGEESSMKARTKCFNPCTELIVGAELMLVCAMLAVFFPGGFTPSEQLPFSEGPWLFLAFPVFLI